MRSRRVSKATRARYLEQRQTTMITELDDGQRRDAFRRKIDAKIGAGSRGGVDADVTLIALVGPPEAEVLLSYSRGNRNESASTVDAYARDMAAGRWTVENGNPLVVTSSGRLVNGHHRLRAVLRSTASVRMKISFGNPEEAIDVADGHRPRSMADRFALRGEHNTHRLVAAIRMCMVLTGGGKNATLRRTLPEVEEALALHAEAVSAIRGLLHRKFQAGFWGALLFAYPVDPGAVLALVDEVTRGEGITGPAYAIREYMIRTKSAGIQAAMGIAIRTLYAVRAHIERRPLTKFSVTGDTTIIEWFSSRRPK